MHVIKDFCSRFGVKNNGKGLDNGSKWAGWKACGRMEGLGSEGLMHSQMHTAILKKLTYSFMSC